MQLHNSAYKSILDCAKTVFRTEGLSAFYVSYPTTLCMTVPFTALQFTAYESLSKVVNPKGTYDPTTHCIAGGIAGGIAAGFTTPLDVIKTLLQTRGTANDAELRNVKGLFEAASIIQRRDGWRGFFRGLKPRIVTTMPSTAICWYVSFILCRLWRLTVKQVGVRDGKGIFHSTQREVRSAECLKLAEADRRNQIIDSTTWRMYPSWMDLMMSTLQHGIESEDLYQKIKTQRPSRLHTRCHRYRTV